MSDSENTKTVSIHPTNSEVNKNITIFIYTIFTGYILKNIYEYYTYFSKKVDNFFLGGKTKDGLSIMDKQLYKFSNFCNIISTIAFFLLFSLILLLFIYILKDSYNLNNLNKNLITTGFPIILGFYFLNTILFTMDFSNFQKKKKLNKFEQTTKKKYIITGRLYQLKTNLLYVLNPFNLTLLISIIYMIYWNNWDYPSWKKWSVYISSVIIFNVVLGLIYFFKTRNVHKFLKEMKKTKIKTTTRKMKYI